MKIREKKEEREEDKGSETNKEKQRGTGLGQLSPEAT
jgi:hypothetical protein